MASACGLLTTTKIQVRRSSAPAPIIRQKTPTPPFAYDAVFALAKALHVLIEGHRVVTINGDDLMAALTQNVSFVGVTGQVEFQDASSDPDRHLHGDRIGSVYDVRTHSNASPTSPPPQPQLGCTSLTPTYSAVYAAQYTGSKLREQR